MQITIMYVLFFLMVQCSYGADDNQSWTKVSFSKKLPYSLKLDLAQGLRMKNQVSTLNQAFFEVSIAYKDSNGFRINIPYRYTIFEDKIKHRLSFGLSYQFYLTSTLFSRLIPPALRPVSLKYRIKFYRLYENGESVVTDGETLGDLIRNKLTIKYQSGKKIKPYISGELFHIYNIDNNPLDEYRASFGIEFDLPRKNSINIFYTLKKEYITKSISDQINIFGLNFSSKI